MIIIAKPVFSSLVVLAKLVLSLIVLIWPFLVLVVLVYSQINTKESMMRSTMLQLQLLLLRRDIFREPCQMPKMELFAKIVNGWKTVPIFANSPILNVWKGFEYNSVSIYILGYILSLFGYYFWKAVVYKIFYFSLMKELIDLESK